MKTIWTILATIAVANVLAFGGLLVWLQSTDRLSRERVRLVRETFAQTVTAEQQAMAAKKSADETAKSEAAAAEKLAQPPKTAAETIAEHQRDDEQKLQAIQRKQQELENLRSSLMTQLGKLEDREKQLAADREAFNQERKRIAETEGAQQFKEALATLEGQKAKDAKEMLKAMIDAKQGEQAVSYLAKMDESKRAKVMAEFAKQDAALAADLLERLRTRGLIPAMSGSAHESERRPTALSGTAAAAEPAGRSETRSRQAP